MEVRKKELFNSYILLFAITLSMFITSNNANEFINLSDEKWILMNEKRNITLPVQLPDSVHTVLMQQNIIKDPYFGYRDVEYAWISDEEWVFQTTFTVSDDLLKLQLARLTFYGLDTISQVFLNKHLIGRSDNMFTTYSFLVKELLSRTNTLKVYFDSPTKYAVNQSETYFKKFGYEIPPVKAPPSQHGRDHPNFIRKEQSSFSWDWGPSFPTIGVWKDVVLEFSQMSILDDVLVHVDFNEESNMFCVITEVVLQSYEEGNIIVAHGFDSYKKQETVLVKPGIQKISLKQINVNKNSIKLWWPRGYGNQALYQLFVRISDMSSLQFSWKEVKFGFKTVELVQEKIVNSDGLSFYFKINSQPMFLKGANWIPADSFQERVSHTVLEDLFNSTVAANINTLRVWGGGIYEQDKFYELADEFGILIWQDLMYAVALYPVNKEFLTSVKQEIISQVRHLQHHPCLIAWSGNNENEAAIAQNWWSEVRTNRKQFISDYIKLYVDTIKPIIEAEDWTHPFVTSSPSNGVESEEEGYISKNPQNPLYGDVHFYDYYSDCWDVSTFPNPRFASEYGYQSYPSLLTLSKIASEKDLTWNGPLMKHRQHHAYGNREIESFIQQHFELPSSTNPLQYFRYMTYLSQIVQATCVKYESEHYRRLQGNLINGTGYTMGALYWQLNDIWQAPSWSSIEYGGRWKMLHYYVRNFFSPTAITGYVQNDVLKGYLVCDYPEKTNNLLLNVTVYKWFSFDQTWHTQLLLKSCKSSAALVHTETIKNICPNKMCFVKFILIEDFSKVILSETDVFLHSFSDIRLKDPDLKLGSFTSVKNIEYNFEVVSSCPAAFVWLETSIPGRFSDNGFIMASPRKKVTFYSWHPINVALLQSSLKLISLYDSYKSK